MSSVKSTNPSYLNSLLFAVALVYSLPSSSFTVVIDPGHGGGDHGATEGTIIESKIALQVALKLAAKFQNDTDIKVILTREQDNAISLKQRVKVSSINKADLFISLHGNSSGDRRAKGAEFYFGGSSLPKEETASPEVLGTIINDIHHNARLYQSQTLAVDSYYLWKSSTLSQPRAIKQAPFYVINRNSTPSILVEFGFLTNAKESLELLKDETQELIAQNLHSAIRAFRDNKSSKSIKQN